jgi:PhnB protein
MSMSTTETAPATTTAITPYLFFFGRCEEALAFYKEALGAEIEMLMKFEDSPEPAPPGMLQEGFEKKVMHASFRVGGAQVMASDGCNDAGTFAGFRLAYTAPTEEVARKAFEALAEGGSVQMPLGRTFWSPCYGMLIDKYNVGWMVTVPMGPCNEG